MASKRIQGITIEIGGDTTKLQSALKEVDTQLRTTKGNLKDIDKLLKLNPGNTELLSQKQRNLQTAIKDTQDRLKELKSVQKDSLTPEQYDALQREIIETETNLRDLQRQYRDFGSVAKQQILAVAEKMKEVGKKVADTGDNLTRKLTMPIVAGFGAAIKVTADFDQQMSKVKAILGDSIDTTAFEKLRQTARDVAASTKFDANEVAKGYEYMAMAGWKAGAMLGGIKPVMDLATASEEELGTVSDIVTDNMTAFGLTIDSVGGDVDAFNKLTTHFTDVLAAASTNSNTNVTMMGESFKYAAANASAMRYSAEDTAIALGLMANAGIKSGQAGRALRNIFSRIAKPTDESAEAIKYFNLSTLNADGSTKSFRQIMEQLRAEAQKNPEAMAKAAQAAQDLTKQYEDGQITEEQYNDGMLKISTSSNEFLANVGKLAGAQGMAGLLSIINSTEEDFNKLTVAIDNSDGTAAKMAEEMNNNFIGQLTILMSKVKDLAISFGDILTPYVRGAVEWVQGLTDKFNSLDEGTKKTIVQIGAIVAAIGPVLAIGGRLITGIGSVISLLTGPVGIVVAIGAVVAAIVTHWDEIKAWAEQAAAAITTWFDERKKKVTEWFTNAKATVDEKLEAISTGFKTAVDNAKAWFEDLGKKIKSGWDTYFQPVVDWINDKFTGAIAAIQPALNGIVDFINNVFSGNWEAAWDNIVSGFGNIFGGIGDLLKTPINGIIGMVNTLIGKVESAVNKIIKGLNSALTIHQPPIYDNLTGKEVPGSGYDISPNLQPIKWGRISELYKGGTLGEGQRAIVGEYAPEYLRVVNGRAIVTPMTNQPARLGGNQTVNITINAQPGQSAEQIAAAVKRVFVREMQERSAAYA